MLNLFLSGQASGTMSETTVLSNKSNLLHKDTPSLHSLHDKFLNTELSFCLTISNELVSV
jgi:hypothetical protein